MSLKVVGISLLLVLILAAGSFLGYVSTRPSAYRVARTGIIHASREKIFPYLSSLKKGVEWMPFEKMDPDIKRTFSGEDGAAGSAEDFDGPKSGTGRIEVTSVVPNQLVLLKLNMRKPFETESMVEYQLKPKNANETEFSWHMKSHGGFSAKFMSMMAESFFGSKFEEGIDNLRKIVEGGDQPQSAGSGG